ncbi:RHS repeat-associated core domain-containing protein [Lelliottia wanjuensis]|uniref:RHS repeat-associated core domain-containing protein n=2 Tax=Lelliottia wanjuensis TaxID=3050585 RepID=A0AAP4D3K0_9ENTR|nr:MULTISPECIES: RHS repeat-associated core domain-containing protein [unclassified Lelliottia]MDK9364601.1 RHS repeat-associated core domain-containing protein [Lelliottia sp. V106_12]MDK9616383.1 RHS repeat-associated core domain-containing protein [Lelliottia sp. V106_9]
MTGKPAARQGDMTAIGGPIVQGSLGVMIGAPTGVACSVCPGGVVSGSPVNPLLGAKVLPGETDLALPGPLPFVLSRTYSSYRTKTPAPEGLFGPGWKAPSDIHLQLRDNELILNDNGGRSIHFDLLLPGEVAFSRTESFWLARGGVLNLNEVHPLHRLWQALPEDVRLSPNIYLATNSLQGPWWLLGWAERVPSVDEPLPAPLPPYRVLTGLVDNFGRTLTFHRAPSGEFAGSITGVTDGAGRRFRLGLTSTASGVRLSEVWLAHDPEYPGNLPVTPLTRYDYSPRGELSSVYDRSGTQVRQFTYDDRHPGRMVAHQYAGRPQTTYRYDATGRVTEQHNPDGLSFRYQYEKHHTVITDSLNRREVLHTEGEGGLKRVVKKERADGSITQSEFDNAGRLVAQTDAAGRRTEYRLSPGSGLLAATVTPDGRLTEFYYNSQRQLTATVYPDGLESRQEYDDAGRLTADTSRQGDVTRYEYDDPCSEYPSATEDPTGSRKQMTWSRYGQLLTYTDCSGYETRYEYDRFGQLTVVHREEGLSQYRAYDARGRLAVITDAAGQQTRYEYNVAGDLTAVISPDGQRSETGFDARGNIVLAAQGTLTRRMAYDAAGRVTTLTNENGSHTEFAYDALDRLTQETGFDGRIKRYRYNASGQLIQSEDESLTIVWQYDDAGRLLSRTVNGEPAEKWQYDARGWLTDISHLSGGHRVAVHYTHDNTGRVTGESQTVHSAETHTLLWQHETKHDYRAGLANRVQHDRLPPVEWLTYGSGYLAGMKLGDMPLIEYTRDRLHRETQRRFGGYALETAYAAGGQLQSHHLNIPQLSRDYTWNADGQLTHIRGPHDQRDYGYENGRLFSTHIQSAHHDLSQQTPTDPAGNRTAAQEALPDVWRDNRITQDAEHFYHYDVHGSLTEKDERRIHQDGSITHHYGYDNQHRLTHYQKRQNGHLLTESRYAYDPLGRRICKQVWHGQIYDGIWYLPTDPAESVWYGWDGDRLTTTQTDTTRIQTVYQPGTFAPLIRIETATGELTRAIRRTLAEKLQQDADMVFVPELVTMLDNLECELQTGQLSDHSRQWLTRCGLTPEQMKNQMEPEYTPARKIHLYHCDHRGLPLALVSEDGSLAWQAEFDEWGNLLHEENPESLQQLIRLPGQQYDVETGLYYNRHRYYDPRQGRYNTQDPIGLAGDWNAYVYPLDPTIYIDPLGLKECTGSARVLQGNSRLVGKGGGYNTNPSDLDKYGVTTDSSAIIPSQWGFKDKPTARDKINSISGRLKDDETQLFSCIRDILDDYALRKKKVDPQKKLMDKNPGKLILEIPGLDKDMGVQDVIITIPDSMDCPSGTQ